MHRILLIFMKCLDRATKTSLASLFFLLAAASAHATIRYEISLAHPEQHLFHVTVRIPVNPVSSDVTVAMPAWTALYQVRDFAYRLRDLHVIPPNGGVTPGPTAGGAPSPQPNAAAGSLPTNGGASLLPMNGGGLKCVPRKLDKQTWRIGAVSSCALTQQSQAAPMLTLQYAIEWDDPGPFSSQLDSDHAFLNFAEVLLYLPDRRAEDVAVRFDDVPASWRAIAELPAPVFFLMPNPSANTVPNSFAAASYDALTDAPVEISKFDELQFDNDGAHFRVAVDAGNTVNGNAAPWDKPALEESLRRITHYELRLMGGSPFKEYTFLFHIGPYAHVGGGGMEHSNSTAIAAPTTQAAVEIAAHEFFHAWNVKRIRPQTLEPVDYTKEQFTRALWFAEGVTSAYASYTLERTGIWSKERFYSDLADQISDLESRPARKWQSAEESSLDAWFEKYGAYNAPDRSVSYYDKGQLLGVLLDLAIRDATDNHKSLDDVLRRMNVEYAQAGKYYDDSAAIRAVVEEVAGKSFEEFFSRYVSGTDDIPYDKFFSIAGLQLNLQSVPSADLGFEESSPFEHAPVVSAVESGGPAEAAGLHEGDVVSSVNGKSVASGGQGLLENAQGGSPLRLRIDRDGEALEVDYTVGTHNEVRAAISESHSADQRQRRIREGVLRSSTD
jgi:predicted metalloprotease with PDZ domain